VNPEVLRTYSKFQEVPLNLYLSVIAISVGISLEVGIYTKQKSLLSITLPAKAVLNASSILACEVAILKDKSVTTFLLPWYVAEAVAMELATNYLSANWLSLEAADGIFSFIAAIPLALVCSAYLARYSSVFISYAKPEAVLPVELLKLFIAFYKPCSADLALYSSA